MQKLQRYFGLRTAAEFWTALALGVLLFALKLWAIFAYSFNSDEPQHLHVVWAWTHGLVQYRDVFDNHMPFFQLACAPVLALLGEHARDLYLMRLLMLPLYLFCAWTTYQIGAVIFSRRAALWAVLGTSSIWKYFSCSTEFRPDLLWSLLCLLSVLVLIRETFRWRNAMVAGALLGLAFAVTMKSFVMLLALSFAGATTWFLTRRRSAPPPARAITATLLAFLACMSLPSLVVMAFFAANGAWPQFRYCVFDHNLRGKVTPDDFGPHLHLLLLPVALPVIVYLARSLMLRAPDPVTGLRRAFVCSLAGSYFALLLGVWHHVTRQDYLPFLPLVSVLVGGSIFEFSIRARNDAVTGPAWPRLHLPALATILLIFGLLIPELVRSLDAARELNLVRSILILTGPGDYIFDCKGEGIFRRRCVYEVFEGLTTAHIRAGLTPDDVEHRCVATRTCVAAWEGRLPPAASEFIEQTYLSVNTGVRVAGCFLEPKLAPDDAIP
ncbi:MAG: glycosyltransferase family 39 protein, partial [Verrucomicrobiota bacterium]|nr:glycosyltransferase family 39 protein [Verrucomicrobiota bacterium]